MKLEITNDPRVEDDDYIIGKTREYNSKYVPNEFELLSVFYKTKDGEVIAGLTGKTFWDWLHVDYLWVSEPRRGDGLGSKVMLAAEKEAIERGCVGSTLDTFSFQALEFYKSLDYSIVGTLSGYMGKYERYFLQKRLG
ncbi:GNAT family N-acetyltransferase [Oceanicoccus sagamiensis]|uniref:N-acetyltransferase domain-containing protein n=1 Tax=Oceanicoccus sagamiensis TaxID=716816 RepID=A0A1X9NMX1_9GAMM|nr:GNAT family N-acetyltransferase [Oceanicoccus sagamiensis]ARN75253.1 hypothetical protein BST96_14700 [Oceanicoccus sagamiensis]